MRHYNFDRKGALKRGFSAIAVVIFIFAAVMANYAMSDAPESSVYDKVFAGDYIDTGLDKTRGISMDLVEKGLTHKVLEFKITSEIAAQDIELLIAENNFDANAGSLSKFYIATKEEPVYETVCNPYTLPEEVNGSIVTVENCTRMQTGTRMVNEEQWLPVVLKAIEKADTSSLSTFNILGKGKYRYSFDTPIVETANGWGNTGTVFLKIGVDLYADKQHSSDWNETWQKRRLLSFNEVENEWRNNTFLNFTLGSFMSDSAYWAQGNFRILEVSAETNETSWVELPYECRNQSFYNPNISCANALSIDYFGFLADTYSNGSYKNYYVYYDNINPVGNSESGGFFVHWLNNYTSGVSDTLRLLRSPIYSGWAVWRSAGTGIGYDSIYFSKDGYGGVVCRFAIPITQTGGDYDCVTNPDADTRMQNYTRHNNYTQKVFLDSAANIFHLYNITNQNVITNYSVGMRLNDNNPITIERQLHNTAGASRSYVAISDGLDFSLYLEDVPLFNISGEERYNLPPLLSAVSIYPSLAYTGNDLNCSFIVTDANAGDTLTANVSWYNGTSLYNLYVINVTNGSPVSNILTADKTAKGQTWNCSVIAYDGYAYSNASSAVRYINNSMPNITSYNASNATQTDTLPNVNFSEGENITFVVSASDADVAEGDTLWYSWFVDSILQPLEHNSWFERAFNFLSAGLYIVRVDVNDSSNAKTNLTWYVTIANAVNKQWSVDYATPTPVNNTILTDHVVNISVLVAPSAIKEATTETFTDSSEADFDNGTYENTNYSLSKLALVLNQEASYESVFDDGFESGMGNWVVTGAGTLWNAQSGSSRTGAYHAEANNTGVGSTTYMYRNISTLGYTGINVSYYRQLVSMGSNDLFAAEWYNGTGWTYLEYNITGGNDADYVPKSFVLPSIANDNSAFRLRFACQNGQATEKCRLDDVAVSGTTIIYVAKGNFTSRVFNASEEAVWETINWSSDVGSGSSLKFKVKSCANADCSDASFTGDYYTSPGSLIVNNNQYAQYKAFFETTNSSVTPLMYNVTIKAHTLQLLENVTISSAWIDFNGVNKPMSGSGFSWSYANSTLDKGIYTYKVYVNDSFGNVNATETRVFSVPSYTIYFNVISGEDGSGINDIIEISCSYSGFDQNEDTTNMYGPYEFPVGIWSCSFNDTTPGEKLYWNEMKTFNVVKDENITLIMSSHGGLSYEEHTQLDWLYNCWRYGECDAYEWVKGTYINISRIWNEYIPTNISVVANETFISKTLSASSNITIDYKINVPYKKGVEDKALLPIRIFYWFTNASGACYNQDKQADSNRAETPFCIPLMAESLGPNNGSTNFNVVLKPNLSYGTYEVVRQIDIDPPVNGVQTWINYGREKIGIITILNPAMAATDQTIENSLPSTVEAIAPSVPTINAITGMTPRDIANNGKTYGIYVLIGLAMICITRISSHYFKSKK